MNIPSWTYKYDLDKNRFEYHKIIDEVFDSGRLIFGKQLENFELEFSNYIGVNYGLGCDNATNGIFLSLKALGIKKKDKVITVPNTAIPTVSAIRQAGGEPLFVDVNKHGLMETKNIEKVINEQVKFIIPVHLYGFPCDMFEVISIANKYNLKVIEDCSQAHGASIKNKKVGSFADASVFSFYPTKSLGAFGDAGMVCTSKKETYESLKKLRFYGISSNYIAQVDGYNSRMDEIQAGILRIKLKNLDKNINARKKIADFYKANIRNDFLSPLEPINKSRISNYLIPFVVNGNRDEFQEKLLDYGIHTNASYKVPIHLMPAYKGLGHSKNDFPFAEKLCDSIISFPIFDNMPYELFQKVVEIVNSKF